jgi:predicted flavoprotein YhiN
LIAGPILYQQASTYRQKTNAEAQRWPVNLLPRAKKLHIDDITWQGARRQAVSLSTEDEVEQLTLSISSMEAH